MKHAAVLCPVEARAQQSPEHHVACMHLERQERILERTIESIESESCDHYTQVAAGTDQRGNKGQLLPVGTMPWLVPSAICTNRLKRSSTVSATFHGWELSTSPKQGR